jgi:Flp pilus assembly pilin Flp
MRRIPGNRWVIHFFPVRALRNIDFRGIGIRGDDGQTLVEFALIIALIAIVVIVSLGIFGAAVADLLAPIIPAF